MISLDLSKQRKMGVMLSYVSIGITYLIAMLYTPVMLRLLGKSEYGLYTLSASVVNYLSLLSFGMGASYVRFYTRYKASQKKEMIDMLNSLYILIFSVIGCIAVGLGVLLLVNADFLFGSKLSTYEIEKSQILMAILTVNIAISFPASVFSSYLTANEKFVVLRLVQILKQILNPVIALPLLLSGHDSIAIVSVFLFLNIAADVVYMYLAIFKMKMRVAFKSLDFSVLKEIFIFSFFIFLNSIVNEINWNVDKFLLGIFWGTGAVASYGVAAQLNNCYLSFSTAISNVYVPKVNQIISSTGDNKMINELFIKISRRQFFVQCFIVMCFVFLGAPFIRMWAGTDYSDSYWIIVILSVSELIPLTQNMGIEIQRAKNKHQFRAVMYTLIALLNFGLSIPLGMKYGGVGCASGTALGQILGNTIIMNWYYQKKLGVDIKQYWENIIQIIPSLIFPTIIGLIILFIRIHSFGMLILCGVLLLTAYSLSIWRLGFLEQEKGEVLKFVYKFR